MNIQIDLFGQSELEAPATTQTEPGRPTRTDRMEEARAVLQAGLSSVGQDPEALAAYLRFRALFRTYSPTNTLLIMLQRPGSQFCMGYRQWIKHGRQVRRGEKGLMIYAPVLRRPTDEEVRRQGLDPDEKLCVAFRIAFVFDIGQTEPIPGKQAIEYVNPIPRLSAEGYGDLCRALEQAATRIGFTLVESSGTEDGYCVPARREIGIRPGLSSADRAAVLAHELAHALAHDGTEQHVEREVQAEGAAYLACYALGLDTSRASLPYLKHCAGTDEALWSQLARLEEIAHELLELVDANR
jgi:antirestriction protein ArdC